MIRAAVDANAAARIRYIRRHDRVDKMLAKLTMSLSPTSMSAFLGTVVFQHLSRRARERFDKEGDDAVGTWVPLEKAPKTLRESGIRRQARINVRTGHLEDSSLTASRVLRTWALVLC